ncbi:hypothetical protein D3C80_1490130 [compost metagenome]
MNGVRGIADQGQALGHITLGMALTQGHAHTWVGFEHRAQAPFESALQFFAKCLAIQGHQALGLSRGCRPDDRTPIVLAIAQQRQEGQRAVIGKALPGGALMGIGATHAGDDGVVQVIPFTGLATGQAAYCRIGAIGGDDQGRTQVTTIGQG